MHDGTMEDDTCRACGYHKPADLKPAFKTQTLILSGQIGMNVYVDLQMLTLEERKACTMEFTVDGKTSEDTFDPNCMNPKTQEYYGFTCYINCAQMSETIIATLHYGDGKTVSGTMSVRRYVDFVVENPAGFTEEEIALVKTIADYGHYMTPFVLKYGTGVERDTEIECYKTYTRYDVEEAKDAVAGMAINKTDLAHILTAATYKLALGTETAIRVFFKAAEGKSISDMKNIAVSDASGRTLKKARVTLANGRYCVKIPNINAAQLADRYQIAVTDSEGETAVFNVSALSYANTVMTYKDFQGDGISDNAMTALYRYYQATKQYVSS